MLTPAMETQKPKFVKIAFAARYTEDKCGASHIVKLRFCAFIEKQFRLFLKRLKRPLGKMQRCKKKKQQLLCFVHVCVPGRDKSI